MEPISLSQDEISLVQNGGKLKVDRMQGDGPWALLDANRNLVAVHEIQDGVVVVGVVIPKKTTELIVTILLLIEVVAAASGG